MNESFLVFLGYFIYASRGPVKSGKTCKKIKGVFAIWSTTYYYYRAVELEGHLSVSSTDMEGSRKEGGFLRPGRVSSEEIRRPQTPYHENTMVWVLFDLIE